MSRICLPLICLVCCSLLLPACNKKEEKPAAGDEQAATQSPANLIAVIDLNLVALEIGAQAKIDVALQAREKQLQESWDGLNDELQRRVDELQQSGSDDADLQKRIDALRADNRAKLELQKQNNQVNLVSHHSALKQKLLSDIRPVAYEVAQEKGMQIVMTVSQVYAAGPGIDITQAVINKIQDINSKQALGSRIPESVPQMSQFQPPGGGDFVPR